MRLFTGLDLPAEVVQSLGGLLDRLRPTADIQWCRPANLHITTKFIGEWPEPRLPELKHALKHALADLPPHPAREIRIRELGFFPNPRSPRVFWCGIEAPGLQEVAAATDDATASLGIPRENRPYSPHLTLARIKERLDLRPLHSRIEELKSREFGEFQARSFFLYQSRLSPGGSEYTKLAEFPLTR